MKTDSLLKFGAEILFSVTVIIGLCFAAIAFAQETTPADATGTPTEVIDTISEVTTSTNSGVFIFPAEEVTSEVVAEEAASVAVESTSQPSTTENNTASVVQALSAPVLTTDKDDYHPGTVATIFGNFFTPLQSFVLKIFGSDENDQNYTEQTETITTDTNGSFSFQYVLDSLYRPFYRMAVSTPEGAPVADSYFRDSSIGTYDQCSNDLGTGYASGDTGCRWTNGNIQSNNSRYFEGDATVQRLWIKGYAPGSTHTVTFQYGTTKAGKHAYDYLTNWNHSENWVTVADRCQGITGCDAASDASGVMKDDPNVPNTIEPSAASRAFTIRGGTIGATSIPAIVSGTYAGDSETAVTITFTTAAIGTPMCETTTSGNGQNAISVTSCGVAIWFGAHVALGSAWTTENGTTGAGSISGSPYHVALDKEDGASVGQRDNQMQSAAILPPAATGIITIIKDTVPDDAQDFAFTTSGTGLSNFSLDDDANITLSNTKTFSALADGTYGVTETPFAGFDLTNLVCTDLTGGTVTTLGTGNASINLTGGETVTCTFTNTKRGSLTIVKNAVGGNDTFNFTGTTGVTTLTTVAGTANQVVSNILPGTYNIAETAKSGWTQTSATCSDGSPVSAIDVAAGENVTCTFTNSKNATLTLVKTVTNDNGGTAIPTAWTLAAAGPTPLSGVTGNAAVTNAVVNSGAYTLSENSGPAGYTASTYSCVKNATAPVVSNSITLAAGDVATCTINNNDNAPALHLRKVVVNDNGGTKTLADFTLTANGSGTNDISGTSPVDSGASLLADTFALSESSVAGYTASAWVCVDGTQNGANVTLGLGESATCTITNDDIGPKLTVTKVVINHGGTKVVSDFPLSVDATGVTSGVQNNFNAGAHTVSEVGSANYTATISGDCNAQTGAVNLALGEVKACTITNEEKLAHLTVQKVVINHGQTNDATHFAPYKVGTTTVTLGVSNVFKSGSHTVTEGTDANYTATFSGACDANGVVSLASGDNKTCTITNEEKSSTIVVHKVVVNHGLANNATHFAPYKVGTTTVILDAVTGINSGTYSVSELADANYTATFSGDCNAQGSVTVTPGSAKSCTITNTEIPTHLTVVKVVINHGQTNDKTHFAPYKIGTTTITEGASNLVNSGTHSVSEVVDPNYTQTFSANCLAGSITLASGDNATCTITNEEKLSDITVKKVVINHGGSKIAADFAPYKVDTTGVTLDVATTFNSGSHTVTEGTDANYTATFSGDCDAQGVVTLGSGDHKTCTITNEEKPAKIVVTKIVVNNNGGTKVVSNFPLFVGATGVTSGDTNTFNSGSYTVSETGDAGYAATISGDCDAETGAVTLVPGVTKHCTITNDDKPAHLIVVKHVDNGTTGATGVATNFTTTIAGVTTATPTAAGSEAGINNTLTTVGAYAVTEGAHAGYTMSTSSDCAASIALGETKTCTITNTAIAPKLTVIKIVDNGNTKATTSASAFQMMVDAGNVPQNVAQTEVVGTHAVTESGPVGYTSVFSGACDKDGMVTLALADNKTCTITNTAIAPKLKLVKTVINDNGGTKIVADFPLSVDTTVVTSGVSNVTTVGAHTASEIPNATYTASVWGGDCATDGSISLSLGDDKTCTITNDDIAPKLHLRKVVVNDNGGTKTLADFTLTADGVATNDISGPSPVDSGATLQAGTFALSETNVTGYAPSAWVCFGGTQNGASVTVGIGQEATCTITNDDIAPHLIVIKHVINDNGGTAVASAFTTTISGVTTANPTAAGAEAPGVNNILTSVGAYGVVEGTHVGYTMSTSSDCAGTIALGETKTCTITNNDIAPHLIVIKHVINDSGDVALASDFTMHLTGTNLSTNDFAGNEAGVNVTLNAGAYTADEVTNAGYVKTLSADCSGTIALGETKTCTITNNDIPHPTRTQGFWQTHTTYTSNVFTALMGSTMKIGTNLTKIDSVGKLFGGFFASIPKKTVGGNRTDVDKARMQLLQQLIAAKLNCAKFTCSASTLSAIAAADTAYQSGTVAQILAAAGAMDAYNNSNDALPISGQGSATPNASKAAANLPFWNVLP